jgi:hypothetical protein
MECVVLNVKREDTIVFNDNNNGEEKVNTAGRQQQERYLRQQATEALKLTSSELPDVVEGGLVDSLPGKQITSNPPSRDFRGVGNSGDPGNDR